MSNTFLADVAPTSSSTRSSLYRAIWRRHVYAGLISLPLTVLMAAVSAPAFAHAHLVSATPAAGSMVAAAPTELDLKFSEGLDLKFTGVKVTGPTKAAVATGEAALGAGDDTTLVVPITDPLAPGSYTVVWHALSTDGHKTNGTYRFTVKP